MNLKEFEERPRTSADFVGFTLPLYITIILISAIVMSAQLFLDRHAERKADDEENQL